MGKFVRPHTIRAFNTGGHVLEPFRRSLPPKCVQTLVCVQDWLREETNHVLKKAWKYLEQFEIGKVLYFSFVCVL